jgi:hypothetical protein
MALHPDLPEYIAGFQGEPEAYEVFVSMVSLLLMILTAYMPLI